MPAVVDGCEEAARGRRGPDTAAGRELGWQVVIPEAFGRPCLMLCISATLDYSFAQLHERTMPAPRIATPERNGTRSAGALQGHAWWKQGRRVVTRPPGTLIPCDVKGEPVLRRAGDVSRCGYRLEMRLGVSKWGGSDLTSYIGSKLDRMPTIRKS